MTEHRMLNPETNQHQNYLIHHAWNQSDLQAMKMQMKDYDDNPEGFVVKMLFYINSNKATHDDVIKLMTTGMLLIYFCAKILGRLIVLQKIFPQPTRKL